MKKLLVLLIIVFNINACSSNKNIQEQANSSTVSKVYDDYTEFMPRLQARPSDKTVYVVNFWATWCTQCRKEIPEMVKLEENFKKDKNVRILYVNLDESDRQDLVNPFLAKYNIKGEVIALTDTRQEAWIEAINKDWTGSLPGTLFFKGNHRKFYGYPLTYDELERNIKMMKDK